MSSASYRSLQSEHRLAEVIGQMVRAAQQDGEAIPRSVFGEIFFRYGSVPQQPVGPRHSFNALPQMTVNGVPRVAYLFVRRSGRLRLVGIGDEGGIKLGMEPFSQSQQRQHRVVYGCEMSPQVKQSVSSRRYFPLDLLGREASKKLVRPLDLRRPYFQPESYVRAFVSHRSVSCEIPFICALEKSVRTWARHFSIALQDVGPPRFFSDDRACAQALYPTSWLSSSVSRKRAPTRSWCGSSGPERSSDLCLLFPFSRCDKHARCDESIYDFRIYSLSTSGRLKQRTARPPSRRNQ